MKALEILQKSKTVGERAEQYSQAIKKDLEYEVIRSLEQKIEKLKSRIFDLGDMTLDTNLNKGLVRMSQEDCQARFKELISAEYELLLSEEELTAKKEIFAKYFGL